MDNPWAKLPDSPPYLLPAEKPIIQHFNNTVQGAHKIRPELMPEPYLGRPDAPIVLLNLNPGFDEREIPFHNDHPYFMDACRNSLLHEPLDYPFYLLDPKILGSLGHQWWKKKLRAPIESAGVKKVANTFLCIEYFPYHSKKYKDLKYTLGSQRYSYHLLREAINREALIIQMRSKAVWQKAVPELKTYSNYFELKNSQNVSISPGNCPEGYKEITNILYR